LKKARSKIGKRKLERRREERLMIEAHKASQPERPPDSDPGRPTLYARINFQRPKVDKDGVCLVKANIRGDPVEGSQQQIPLDPKEVLSSHQRPKRREPNPETGTQRPGPRYPDPETQTKSRDPHPDTQTQRPKSNPETETHIPKPKPETDSLAWLMAD
jgi:hypothetical protein